MVSEKMLKFLPQTENWPAGQPNTDHYRLAFFTGVKIYNTTPTHPHCPPPHTLRERGRERNTLHGMVDVDVGAGHAAGYHAGHAGDNPQVGHPGLVLGQASPLLFLHPHNSRRLNTI